MRDLTFLSGKYFDLEIPKELSWVTKYYFRTVIQKQFLQYYLVFGSVKDFTAHTGIYADPKYLRRLEDRYHRLLKVRTEAKANLDFETLWNLENGKYKQA